jgi:lipid II:glycine glycyltransferase (peptidoglycan interpeptide bridge formation enzyme)
MERRKGRGEEVSLLAEEKLARALLLAGAAEVFQVKKNGKVLSSVLVLKSEAGGYYQSAGTSPEGMALGASHFLIWEVAQTLKDDGLQVFNLGGAEPENAGLQRFKRGFGAREVRLEAAVFSMVSSLKRRLRTAVKLLRDDAAALAGYTLSMPRFLKLLTHGGCFLKRNLKN